MITKRLQKMAGGALQTSQQIVLRMMGAHTELLTNGEHKYLWTRTP